MHLLVAEELTGRANAHGSAQTESRSPAMRCQVSEARPQRRIDAPSPVVGAPSTEKAGCWHHGSSALLGSHATRWRRSRYRAKPLSLADLVAHELTEAGVNGSCRSLDPLIPVLGGLRQSSCGVQGTPRAVPVGCVAFSGSSACEAADAGPEEYMEAVDATAWRGRLKTAQR